jgi:probable phosphoglycerate mutase
MRHAYPELYILRHGETVWNAADRMQGWLNSPLTETGQAQASAQGDILRSRDLTGFRAYSSPQGRAFQTAALALAPWWPDPIGTDMRLREVSVGEWQGCLRSDIKRDNPELFKEEKPFQWYDIAPGGEGFAGLAVRCRDFLEDLTGPSILVTHGMTSRILRCLVLGLEIEDMAQLPGGQGVVYHLKDGTQTKLGDGPDKD